MMSKKDRSSWKDTKAALSRSDTAHSTVSVSLTTRAKKRLKLLAVERGVTVSTLIRQVLEPWVGKDPVARQAVELPYRSGVQQVQPYHLDPLLRPADHLEVSVRVANVLCKLNLGTVGDILAFGPARLLKTRNFGRTSLKNLEAALANIGVTWPASAGVAQALTGGEEETEVEIEQDSTVQGCSSSNDEAPS